MLVPEGCRVNPRHGVFVVDSDNGTAAASHIVNIADAPTEPRGSAPPLSRADSRQLSCPVVAMRPLGRTLPNWRSLQRWGLCDSLASTQQRAWLVPRRANNAAGPRPGRSIPGAPDPRAEATFLVMRGWAWKVAGLALAVSLLLPWFYGTDDGKSLTIAGWDTEPGFTLGIVACAWHCLAGVLRQPFIAMLSSASHRADRWMIAAGAGCYRGYDLGPGAFFALVVAGIAFAVAVHANHFGARNERPEAGVVSGRRDQSGLRPVSAPRAARCWRRVVVVDPDPLIEDAAFIVVAEDVGQLENDVLPIGWQRSDW